ncbi:hypothetical protein GCM10018790_35150 [Kitasatospora xanthocidica]|uniref:hypothetical protein n=1 Tax=Kitasatospora xanthocidica TaxID=83382 RepID=UPI001673B6A4|nr:hypothetical protein [Kitasatospora xanthocidica]GHF54244.1 hypothetical protein GCM10018790_35150 [Kitasatospora xanthocidica]
MTTATLVIDVDRPPARTVRLVPATGRRDRPEPPEPAPAAEADRARTRPANCRFAMHYED